MNDKGNMYAPAALKDRRARIAGEIATLRKQMKDKLAQLGTLDATIRIFSPDFKPETIRNKRPYQRAPLFSHGELGRVILDVLREAKGTPLAGHEVAARVTVKLNRPAVGKMAMTARTRCGLRYLAKNKRVVVKVGSKQSARWLLAG